MALASLDLLAGQVDGQFIRPGDAGYEEARRVHNGMIDARPAAVVRCADTDDVAAVVRFAGDTGTPLAVRGGGHSVPGFGTADDAIVADLSDMQSVAVDGERRTASAGGGTTWGRFNDVTGEHGLATTGGVVSTTGIGGLTLGGGIGYLARGHGLSCDNLLSAEVVTADGSVRTAGEDENADLFWALRGGSGNFGVVTRFTYRVHPVSTILGGPMFFDLADAPAVLAYFREFIRTAPRDYGGFPGFHIAPPLPFIPEDRHGRPHLAVVSCWAGAQDEGERVLQGFRDVARPVAEHVGPMPYPALNAAFDALYPKGLQHYWKTAYAKELTDEAIAAHLEYGSRTPSVHTAVHLYPIDGAVQDVPSDATAFGHRDASFAFVIAGMWADAAENEANIRWVKDYHAAIAPYSEPGGYVNFASSDDQAKVADNYGANYARLREVKRRYDPDNLFRLNQNIRP
ncbi:FAD-binding oxidoreductase [Geodermatophilus sp. URMC 64]